MVKWDNIELKIFSTTKEMVSKLKRPPTKWEKIFASCTSDKGLITRIYRKLKNVNFPQIIEPVKKWATNSTELFQRKKPKCPLKKKHMKKILIISVHKGNAN
jgi:hypothetical protein